MSSRATNKTPNKTPNKVPKRVPSSETLKSLNRLYPWMQQEAPQIELFSPIHKKELLKARLYEYHSLASTQILMRDHAQTFFQSGDIVWTHEQTAGRGRGTHSWTSQSGYSLTFSCLLRRAKHRENFFYTQLTVLALARALESLESLNREAGKNSTGRERKIDERPLLTTPSKPPLHCVIKWPNDVLIHGRKIAGVLISTTPVKGNPGQTNLIVGVGLNALEPPEVLAEYHKRFKDQDYIATSFYNETGQALSLDCHLRAFLREFFSLEALFLAGARKSLLAEWNKRHQLIGRVFQSDTTPALQSKFPGAWQVQKVSVSGVATLTWVGSSSPTHQEISSATVEPPSRVIKLTLEELGL